MQEYGFEDFFILIESELWLHNPYIAMPCKIQRIAGVIEGIIHAVTAIIADYCLGAEIEPKRNGAAV